MKAWQWFATIAVLAALSAGAIACGDDDDDSSSGDDAGTEATATLAADGGGTTVDITATDFAFDKTSFTVPAGEEINFALTNDGSAPHTFTVYTDEEYTDPVDVDVRTDAGASGSDSGTFEAGEYYYRCEIHPTQMQGEFTAE